MAFKEFNLIPEHHKKLRSVFFFVSMNLHYIGKGHRVEQLNIMSRNN